MLSSQLIFKRIAGFHIERQKQLLDLLAQEEKIDKNDALQRAWTRLNETSLYKQLTEELINYNIETLDDNCCIICLPRIIAGTDAIVVEQKEDYYEITARGLGPTIKCHNFIDIKIIIDNEINNLCLKQKEYNKKRHQKQKKKKLDIKNVVIL